MHSPGYGLQVGRIANGNSLKHIFLFNDRALDAALYSSALWSLRITFALGRPEFFLFFIFHRNCSLQQFFLEHTLDLTQPGPGRLEILRNNLSSVCDLQRLQYLKRLGSLNLLDGSLNPRMVFLYRMQLNGFPRVSDGSTLSFLPRSIAFKSFTHSHAKV